MARTANGAPGEIFARLPLGVALVSESFRIVAANPALLRLLERDGGDVAGLPLESLLPVTGLRERVAETLATGRAQSDLLLATNVAHGGRRFRFALGRAEREGEPPCVAVVVERVSALEDSLAKVRERRAETHAERLYADLVDGIDAIVWEAEIAAAPRADDGVFWAYSFVSRRAETMLGCPPFQWFSRRDFWAGLVHAEDRARVLGAYRDVVARKREAEVEYRVTAASGATVWIADRVRPLFDAFGRVRALRGLMIDVTDRRLAQEALHRSEEKHRAIVRNAPVGIYRSREESRFLDVNPALAAMLGYDSPETLLGVELSGGVYCDERERERLVDAVVAFGSVAGAEVAWRRRDGAVITVRLSGHAVRDDSGEIEAFEMVAEDVTERRALEEQLRQSQKMEAIGRLAGGVAHDFNNLLAVMLGYAQVLEAGGASGRRAVEQIRRAGERAAALTRQLLAFSRRQVLAPQILDLNAVVSETGRMLERVVGEDIEFVIALDPALPPVRVDRVQIEQVVMNLVVNARDAMPRGGRLVLETSRVELSAAAARRLGLASAGEFARLAVSDTGVGMDAATRARIFEPFFTTKERGKGTGLGLSTVYGIVKQSGGHVDVQSEPGKGSTFEVYLPRALAPAAAREAAEASDSASGSGETVLVVEDEAPLRELVRDVLESKGYAVLEAAGGSDAIALADSREGPIDVLLTDVILPRSTGPELAERLRARRPRLRVVYMSGYAGEAIAEREVLEPGAILLEKPFQPETLARRIREALRRPPSPERAAVEPPATDGA